ncbi:MAG: aminotransferase [Gammaproteobacteria bacterium]|nr:aminotransferase [Gammaproteobacteria bacterium]
MLNKESSLSSPTTNLEPAEAVRQWDNRHFLHPWQSMGTDDPNRVIAARAEGIYLFDPDGRRYIDGPGGMWNVQIGYGNEEIAEVIAAQARALAYTTPWAFANEPAALLARKLSELSPGDLNTVFFTTGGSSAVDSALRFTHFYNNLRGRPQKKRFISREKAYHGSTYLAASVSGKERDKGYIDTARDLVTFLPNVNPYVRPKGMDVQTWCEEKVADLENAIIEMGAENVAAFIAEPVLASGGVIVPPPGYHQRTMEICRKHDVLYISDEIVTGFGRLGHWFSSQPVFDIVPDIITCAKGLTSGYLPLGAVLISDRLLEAISAEDRENVLFSNGYTYSGHPVCCAAALKNIEIMERDGLLEHVREVAPHFQSRLQNLKRFEIVGDARGLGLVGCIEGSVALDSTHLEGDRLSVDKEFGYRVDRKCEEMGLIVRPLINMCVFSPPLIITRAQIDDLFDILEEALRQVQDEILA